MRLERPSDLLYLENQLHHSHPQFQLFLVILWHLEHQLVQLYLENQSRQLLRHYL